MVVVLKPAFLVWLTLLFSTCLSLPAYAKINIRIRCSKIIALNPRRPAWRLSIDPVKAKEFIAAYPSDFRPAAEFIVNHARHVTQEEFEAALRRCLDKLIAKLPENSSIAIVGFPLGKSSQWVSQLTLEYFQTIALKTEKTITVYGLQNERDLGVLIDRRLPIKNLVYVEDVSFSGLQLTSDMTQREWSDGIQRVRGGKTYVVVPFMARAAIEEIKRETSPKPVLIYDQILPTFSQVVAKASPEESVRTALLNLFPGDEWEKGLTYFDHNIPDEASIVSIDKRDLHYETTSSVLRGSVPDDDGYYSRAIPFLVSPDVPYRAAVRK